jgi:hypothetical protein
MSETKYGYVVGFGGCSPVGGKGNNSGVGKWTFPLTLHEARVKIAEHHPFPKESEFLMFRLIPVKVRPK